MLRIQMNNNSMNSAQIHLNLPDRCSTSLGSGNINETLPVGAIVVSTSLSSRNEPWNTSLHNGIKPYSCLDSIADLPDSAFRNR